MGESTRTTDRPAAAAIGIIAASAVAAAGVDVLTPPAFEPGLLYLPAILLTAWRFGAAAACVLSLSAASIRLIGVADLSSLATGWTALSWFGSYFVTSLLTLLLRRSIRRERRLARTDLLTGLANGRALIERIEAELNRSRRQQSPLTVAYIDCDRFKEINDRHGHAVGDRVLKMTATAMQRGTRNYDLIARSGGDEFVVVLPETAADEARVVIGRIQDNLKELMRDNGWDVSFSIGVATFIEHPPSAEEAVRAADELMYAVKRDGKNGVRFEVVGVDSLPRTD